MNDAGQIVGSYHSAGTAAGRGFLYNAGVFSTIDVPGAYATAPNGINNAGQVVGYYNTAPGHEDGFLYANGAFATIDVPGAVATEAIGINNAGQIVGLYVKNGISHGFLDTGGAFSTIDLPGARYTALFGINDGGQIVGQFGFPVDANGSAHKPDHGFLTPADARFGPELMVPLQPPTSGVPELSTWAMMLIGFGAIGWRLRRETSVTAPTA